MRLLLCGAALLLLSWGASASESRFCSNYETVVAQLIEEGEEFWFSYRPAYAKHRVEYWRGETTLTRIAPGSRGWCILGGGDEVEYDGILQ